MLKLFFTFSFVIYIVFLSFPKQFVSEATLAQGHFSTMAGGARDLAANPAISGQPALPSEPQPPTLEKQ